MIEADAIVAPADDKVDEQAYHKIQRLSTEVTSLSGSMNLVNNVYISTTIYYYNLFQKNETPPAMFYRANQEDRY